ncbi:MAG: DinB family protein [Bacteroidota bacterium]
MNNQELFTLFKSNTQVFTDAVRSFPASRFHAQPNAQIWSAAQITEHVYRAEFGTSRLFNGATEALSDRESDAKFGDLERWCADRETKVEASGPILPSGKHLEKEELLIKFTESRERLLELAAQQNLDELCTRYNHPVFGFMTRKEWLYFNVLHANRHLHQLDELKELVSK